ncbi:MAG: DUF1579 family protein [Planctomycetota bacterium]|jgi:hypothetical protein
MKNAASETRPGCNWRRLGWALACLALTGAIPAVANDDEDANEEDEVLLHFVGPWNFTERHLDELGKITATVKGTEEVTWQIDKRAIQRAYTRPGTGKNYQAIGLLTNNEETQRYEGTWINNHTRSGPVAVSGKWNAAEKTMSFTLTQSKTGGGTIVHRVLERFLDETQRESTVFRVDGSTVTKIMEVQYIRTKPCPAKIRGLYTE